MFGLYFQISSFLSVLERFIWETFWMKWKSSVLFLCVENLSSLQQFRSNPRLRRFFSPKTKISVESVKLVSASSSSLAYMTTSGCSLTLAFRTVQWSSLEICSYLSSNSSVPRAAVEENRLESLESAGKKTETRRNMQESRWSGRWWSNAVHTDPIQHTHLKAPKLLRSQHTRSSLNPTTLRLLKSRSQMRKVLGLICRLQKEQKPWSRPGSAWKGPACLTATL